MCNLCDASVQFVIARDRRARFKFAPLQGRAAKELLAGFRVPGNLPDSVVLLENGRAWLRSSAILRIARGMDGFWPLLYIFIVVPRPLRDAGYDFVARRRHRWFGHRDTCLVPTPDLRDRFLADDAIPV
jgi:predicted DCC family thiol-disulfide oxidoreductase YuxK